MKSICNDLIDIKLPYVDKKQLKMTTKIKISVEKLGQSNLRDFAYSVAALE